MYLQYPETPQDQEKVAKQEMSSGEKGSGTEAFPILPYEGGGSMKGRKTWMMFTLPWETPYERLVDVLIDIW